MGEEKIVPSTLQKSSEYGSVKPVNFAVVAPDDIVRSYILPSFAYCDYAKLLAVADIDKQNAIDTCMQYGLSGSAAYGYEEVNALLHESNIDVICVSLPLPLKKELILEAAKAGKHILSVNPMAASSADAIEIINTCNRYNVKLMAAYNLQYEPHTAAIREWIKDHVFGHVQTITCSARLTGNAEQEDINYTCIQFINTMRFLVGITPVWVSADTSWFAEDEITAQEKIILNLKIGFPGDIVATCKISREENATQQYRCFTDTNTWFGIDNAFSCEHLRIRLSATLDGKALPKPHIIPQNQYSVMINHMAECILKDKLPDTTGEEAYKDLVLLEALDKSAREKAPVHIDFKLH